MDKHFYGKNKEGIELYVKYFTIRDVLEAGINLEPVICLKCGLVGGIVSLLSSCNDLYCERCGTFQDEYYFKKQDTKKVRKIFDNQFIN